MAGTRNKNTQGNYCMEQQEKTRLRDWVVYENASNGNAYNPRLAGNGLIQSHVGWSNLSNNPCEIESFLFGIGSTNLETGIIPVLTPELHILDDCHIFEKQPIIMPIPQAIAKNQRPLRP